MVELQCTGAAGSRSRSVLCGRKHGLETERSDIRLVYASKLLIFGTMGTRTIARLSASRKQDAVMVWTIVKHYQFAWARMQQRTQMGSIISGSPCPAGHLQERQQSFLRR